MRCVSCQAPAIIEQPARCKEHFIAYFEKKVHDTIAEHKLLEQNNRVAVAVSGGKDSLTVLTLLKRWNYDVTAIAIDEGIAGYREKTLVDARRVCEANNIPLVIHTFESLAGKTLDKMLAEQKQHPCTLCGTFRRHLLHLAARDFDALATGHNADDEAQAVLMNLVKGNTELFSRIGPVAGEAPRAGFVRRVKPLYFCTEKEVATYAFLHGLITDFTECPYVHESYRHVIRDELNNYAQSHTGVKERLLRRFLLVRPNADDAPHAVISSCERCGEPSSGKVCKACQLLGSVKK